MLYIWLVHVLKHENEETLNENLTNYMTEKNNSAQIQEFG